jgi:hypothetical protein
MVTRRNILKLATMAPPLLQSAFAGSKDEFWKSKEPAQWTAKETAQILNHSPWAKQASVDSQMGQGRNGGLGAPSGGSMGRSGGGTGGMGGGNGHGMGGGMGQGGTGQDGGMQQDVRALVRWESALPVSAAEKKSPPVEAAHSYIISVTGLPLRNNNSIAEDSGRVELEGAIKQNTSLERQGKDPIAPAHVEYAEDTDGAAWRFTFPRNGNAITREDKDVIFMTRIGRVSLKAKFSLREMLYKDQLAL